MTTEFEHAPKLDPIDRISSAAIGTRAGNKDAAGRLALEVLRNGAPQEFATNLIVGLLDAGGGHEDVVRKTESIVQGAMAIYRAERADAAAAAKEIDDDEGDDEDDDEDMFIDAADIGDEILAPSWVIEDYLDEVGFSALWGQPGSGKSFVGLSMACCIATGTPWNGHKVKKGPVVYIVGEGQYGVARRIQAWKRKNGVEIDPSMLILTKTAINLLDEPTAKRMAKKAEKVLKEHSRSKPVAVFVDTLARCFITGNENESKDMGQFIYVLNKRIRDRWGCNIVVVHHSGKNGESMRGSSALKGAVDQEFEVKGLKGIRVLECRKMKDGPEPKELKFQLAVCKLGEAVNNLGTTVTVTSCFMDTSVSQDSVVDAPEGKKAKPKIIFMDVLRFLSMQTKWPKTEGICAALGVSTKTLGVLLQECVDVKFLEKVGREYVLTKLGRIMVDADDRDNADEDDQEFYADDISNS